MNRRYTIAHLSDAPAPLAPVESEPWRDTDVARVEWFHPAGSDHQPRVAFRALRFGAFLIARYSVKDRYVRCVHTNFQDPVYEDSCCELFLQPSGQHEDGTGYFNIECNAIGVLMISWITDSTRTADGFAGQTRLPAGADTAIQRYTTLSGPIDPENDNELDYEIEIRLPLQLLGEYSGTEVKSGDTWRGNIYKCSENSSHPHWGAWSPIGDRLEYHQPDRFGELSFL